jgi:hypothetical protein
MMIGSDDGGARWLVLGDCTLVVDNGSAIKVFSDCRLSNTTHLERAAVRAPGAAADPIEYAKRIDALVLGQRAHRNTVAGFWVAASEPLAANYALRGTIALPKPRAVNRIALLNDGASRIVETYQALTWALVLDTLETEGPTAFLDKPPQTQAIGLARERPSTS